MKEDRRSRGRSALALIAIILLAQTIMSAQGGPKQQIKTAMQYYSDANFDKAIEILAVLANDNTLDKSDKKAVLLSLGRAYVAKGLKDKASRAIGDLLDLEPPVIEPDPDAECPPLMKIYYEARKMKTGSPAVERPDPGIKTIAILDFKNRSVDDKEKFDPMEKGFAELLINQLSGSIKLKVVERERIQWIMDEIGMENDPGKFDAGSAVRVGKLLGVHSILLGSFIKVKDQMKLLSRMVKVETGEILATDEQGGDADEFFELTQKLGEKVAKHLDVALSAAELQQGTETKSLDAMLSYSEGLVLVEKGDYKKAYDKFQEALSLDSGYEKARKKAESLKPLIG